MTQQTLKPWGILNNAYFKTSNGSEYILMRIHSLVEYISIISLKKISWLARRAEHYIFFNSKIKE